MTDRTYVFEIAPEEREVMYSAFIETARDAQLWSPSIHTAELERALSDPTLARVTLSGVQVATMLKGLERAIEGQETDSGDWSRAVMYKTARKSLISKARRQLSVVA